MEAAQSVEDWLEKQKVVSLRPSANKQEEVPGHLQDTTQVPLSKVQNPQMLILGLQ